MNKNQNVRRVLSLLFVMVMLVSMMVVGTVTASAAESTNVAKNVDTDVEYPTLQAAIDAAKNNETVLLLANNDESVSFAPNRNVTVDGGKFTFTGLVTVSNGNGATFKFTNATLSPSKEESILAIKGSAAEIVVDNCTCISQTDKWNDTTSMAVVRGTQSDNVGITVQNCPLISGFYYVANFSQGGKSLTINNCEKVTDCVYFVSAGKCVNVTVKASTYDGQAGILMKGEGNPKTLNIEDTTIQTLYPGQLPVKVSATGSLVSVNLTGANTMLDPDGKKFEGSSWISGSVPADQIEGTETVNPAPAGVAQIGETVYETLAEAIANANAGDTIYLLADVEGNVTINKNVTINGAKAGTDGELADDRWQYTGTMTINGATDAKIKHINFVEGTIFKKDGSASGNVTIQYCNFTADDLMDYAMNLRDTYAILIENCVVNGYAGGLQVPDSNVSVDITNLQITAIYYGFKIDYSNGVTMTGVTVTSGDRALWASTYGAKTYEMTDCKFYAPTPIYVRDGGKKDTYNFYGTNEMPNLVNSTAATFKLAEGATLTAPAGLQITPAAGFTRVYSEGVYSLVKTATLNGYLTLGSAIDVNFVYYGDKTLVNDVEVVVTYGEKTYKLGLSYVTEGKYVYNLKGVFSAKQMADEFTVVVMYKGNAISKMYEKQSVKSIANTTLAIEDLSVEAKNLIVALLNYGAAAQEAFDYNADNLANAGLTVESTAEDVKLAEEKNNYTDEDNSYYGASVNLKNELQFNFKFFKDMIGEATYAEVTIGNETITVYADDFGDNNGKEGNGRELVVVTVNVAAAQANEVMYCTFYDANGNAITTAGDSLLSYCVRAWAGLTDMKENNPNKYKDQTCKLEFYQALANYVVAAHGYATTENN